MAQVNPLTREVLIKLVYYGPGLGGKTTTLQRVHGVSPAETRGKIVSLATPVDRTLYFDFLPLRVGPVKGYPVRLQLFTVPGQVYFNATRKLVLTGADGVVFVADSQRERQDANLESYQNLEANLTEQNRRLEDIPHVFQFNKRDLPNVATVEQLNESLNRHEAPHFASAAAKGEGVLEPLDELVRLVLEDLERREVFGDTPGQQPSKTRRQPSFGPSSDGIGASVSRASEEGLWTTGSSGPPRPMPPATASEAADDGQTLASPPPAPSADAPQPTQADLPPVSWTGPGVASSAPPSRPPSNAPETGRPAAPPHRPTFGPQESSSTDSGMSWSALFAEAQRGTIGEVEQALHAGDTTRAVLQCDGLASELLAAVALHGSLPAPDHSPTLLAMAAGLPGDRWLNLCHIARRAKQGDPVSATQALEVYAVLIELNRLCTNLRAV